MSWSKEIKIQLRPCKLNCVSRYLQARISARQPKKNTIFVAAVVRVHNIVCNVEAAQVLARSEERPRCSKLV